MLTTRKQIIPLAAVALAVMLLCLSCENEISYTKPHKEPRLILNALLDAGAETNSIFLHLSGLYHADEVRDGEVKVYVNDEYRETCVGEVFEDDYFRPFAYRMTTYLKPGDKVRLEATTKSGKYRAWAESVIPMPTKVVQVDTATVWLKEYYQDSDLTEFLNMKITMKDDAQARNYYRLVLEQNLQIHLRADEIGLDTIYTMRAYDYIGWEDVALTDGQPSSLVDMETDLSLLTPVHNLHGIFDDSYFTGDQYVLNVNVRKAIDYYPYFIYDADVTVVSESLSVKIRILSITAEEFYYLRALNYYDSDFYSEVFSEPISLPSNVQIGLGIVGTASEASAEISVYNKEYPEY